MSLHYGDPQIAIGVVFAVIALLLGGLFLNWRAGRFGCVRGAGASSRLLAAGALARHAPRARRGRRRDLVVRSAVRTRQCDRADSRQSDKRSVLLVALPDRVPAGTRVRFDVSSIDVNHGFALHDPHGHLIGSVQAMPGYHNELDLTLDRSRRLSDPLLRVLRAEPLDDGRLVHGDTALMEAASTPLPSVLHPGAAAFAAPASSVERRIGFLFAVTGIALIAVMGVVGLSMRLAQATVLDLSPAWFYRLMTLHGVGMITGSLLAMMGALWYVLHAERAAARWTDVAGYGLILAGAVAVLVATLVGGFGAGWTFLPPLPFYPAGQWSVWSESRLLCRTTSRRRRVLRLLHRRAPADDDHLRRPRTDARPAFPARTRAARRHRRRRSPPRSSRSTG